MSRLRRRNLKRGIYHIYNRSAYKMWIFQTDEMKDFFLYLMKKFARKYELNIYHYCVMSNHFHLAIEGDMADISSYIATLGSRYSLYYKRTTDIGGGTIWDGRFRSILVQKEGYLSRLGRYIELNPVRAGVVSAEDIYRYRWSSARHYLYGEADELVIPIEHPFFKNIESYSYHEKKRYADYLRIPHEEDLTLFRSEAEQIGDEGFLACVVRMVGGRRQLGKGQPKMERKNKQS